MLAGFWYQLKWKWQTRKLSREQKLKLATKDFRQSYDDFKRGFDDVPRSREIIDSFTRLDGIVKEFSGD